MTLDQLKKGETAIVTKLLHTGNSHIRLMDLGILPGTHIQAEMVSPLGDPIAYRVRQTLIALRRDQARQIEIQGLEGTES
jgi:ferrous iron transport protein A